MNTRNLPGAIANRVSLKSFLVVLLVVLAVAGASGSFYFYKKYTAIKTNPTAEATKETEKWVSVVGKLMELPKDETPTIATILDKDKLKDQSFFVAGENGDILLAYTIAMKAVLYRPSTNKIVNVAPISINSSQDLTQGTTAQSLRVAYYNGTDVVGLSGAKEKAVLAKYPTYKTATLENAAAKDYVGVLVVDLSGKHSKEAGDLARLLGGKVGNLPKGETAPNADILVISGK